MQTVSAAFDTKQAQAVRKITWAVFISFEKNFTDATDFFEIGTSTIGGPDIIKGEGSVVQEWDKYDYTDYSDRILSIEYDRETEPPTNPISLATADIVLDNWDDMFTPGNANSPLDGFLLPRRPIRIAAGFSGENVPLFVGLTEGKPIIDERSKTARIRCVDFLKSLMDKELNEAVMYQDMRTDEIVADLLEDHGGLSATQHDLDTGTVIIPFAYFPKGTKLGDAIMEIAEAELGHVFMGEAGMIGMHNRTNWNGGSSQHTFDKDEVIDRENAGSDTVINVVEVYSEAREVQAKQKLWELSNPIEVPAGDTVEVFADFKDEYGDLPVTSCDDPAYITSATTSLYATNTDRDGSGASQSSDITLNSTSLFSTGFKMVFENTGSQSVFLTQIELFATPAKVVNDIYTRKVDSVSAGQEGYEEHVHEIKNNYIQDETAANTISQIIISDRAEDDDQQILFVRALPQLQIGDIVTYDDENQTEDFFTTGINGIINKAGFRQKLKVSKRTVEDYFRIEISTIGGSDKLGP